MREANGGLALAALVLVPVLALAVLMGSGREGVAVARQNIAREARLDLTTRIEVKRYEHSAARMSAPFVTLAVIADPATVGQFVAALDAEVGVPNPPLG